MWFNIQMSFCGLIDLTPRGKEIAKKKSPKRYLSYIDIIKTITKMISYAAYRGFVDEVAQRSGTETRYSFCYRFLSK